jgi:hypothetical protein
MSHFAKLDATSIVIFVTVGRQEDDGKEQELCDRTGDVYRQTSYNTRGGVHYDPSTGEPSADQGKAFRKNYAGIGYTYDEARDAFIPPKPFPSWVLNEDTCLWDAPLPYPGDGKMYSWSEDDQLWLEVQQP